VTAIAAGLLLAGAACVEVDGGAIELSWRLRNFEGSELSCTSANIGQVRVCWVPLGDAGSDVEAECTTLRVDGGFVEWFRDFECGLKRGVTRFEVPSGPNAIFVRPICTDGTAPVGDYQVPPPIVRNVERGGVVTLNQLLLVIENDCGAGRCACPAEEAQVGPGRSWQSARS